MTTNTTPTPVNCPRCNNQIGEEKDFGVLLLHAGGGVWRELRGYCAQCGAPFYWSASDSQMQARIKSMRIDLPLVLAKRKYG